MSTTWTTRLSVLSELNTAWIVVPTRTAQPHRAVRSESGINKVHVKPPAAHVGQNKVRLRESGRR